ncbi:MAG TPA: hypothetical protein VK196_22590 [Magnetospirillum sp.]|nr:hypothetical protein [Magnetospirillum sp.]
MTHTNTDPAKEAWIASMTAQIQARTSDQPAPDAPALQPPDGLSPVERMIWARQHQPNVTRLEVDEPLPAQAFAQVPPAVLAMSPADKMRWARRHARTGE